MTMMKHILAQSPWIEHQVRNMERPTKLCHS